MQARLGKKQRHLDVRKIVLHFLGHAQRTRRGNMRLEERAMTSKKRSSMELIVVTNVCVGYRVE